MANSAPPGRLLAFDLETAGLEPRREAIVAVGCVPVEERTILWGRAYRALVDDPRSLRPRDLDALGTHQVLPEEQRGGLERVLVVAVDDGRAGGAVETQVRPQSLRPRGGIGDGLGEDEDSHVGNAPW